MISVLFFRERSFYLWWYEKVVLCKELCTEEKLSLLVVTHDEDFARRTDRIIEMEGYSICDLEFRIQNSVFLILNFYAKASKFDRFVIFDCYFGGIICRNLEATVTVQPLFIFKVKYSEISK